MEKYMDLSRLQVRFQDLLIAYREKTDKEWKEIAAEVGIKSTRLSELLHGNKKLSGVYLEPFIWEGIIKMSDIYDGNAQSQKEKVFWKRMSRAERADLLDVIIQLEEAGLDVKRVMLDALARKLRGG